jgi:hypothetical protein
VNNTSTRAYGFVYIYELHVRAITAAARVGGVRHREAVGSPAIEGGIIVRASSLDPAYPRSYGSRPAKGIPSAT